MPEFFIDELVESLLGAEAVDPTVRARRFVSPAVLEHAEAIGQAFHLGGRVKHVCLTDALRARTAEGIGAALARARFRPHHHAPYRIDVAPLAELADSPLRRFCRWLGTADAARFHGWLTGWPPGGALEPRQVQIARARRGDEFPVHVDMDDEGLSAVYNFTADFGPRDGGELYFPWRRRIELIQPPRFNSLILFRPKGAPHGVRRVRGPGTRFTVTAFFTATR